MSVARVRLPDSIELLLRSEVEQAIEQANLGNFETAVAKKYYIEQLPHVEIAEEFGFDRTVITKRMPRIYKKVERAASRLFGERHTTS